MPVFNLCLKVHCRAIQLLVRGGGWGGIEGDQAMPPYSAPQKEESISPLYGLAICLGHQNRAEAMLCVFGHEPQETSGLGLACSLPRADLQPPFTSTI